MNQSVLNLIAAVERELLLAVVGDSRNPLAEKNFQRIDAYFAADEPEKMCIRDSGGRADQRSADGEKDFADHE